MRPCSSARALRLHARAAASAAVAGGGDALLAALRGGASGGARCATMEHGSGAGAAWAALRGALLASVHTDLPGGAADAPVALASLSEAERRALPALRLQAVGAHGRSAAALEARLRDAGAQRPAALLLVRGDASSRPPGAALTLDTPGLLSLASRLRSAGALPHDTALCAALNPLRDAPDALLRKRDAGAQAFLTQPALLPSRARRWFDAAQLVGGPPVLLGIAMPTRPQDVALWLRLADVDASDDDATQLLAAWRAAADAGPAALARHAEDAARQALALADSLPGLAGVHLMPMSAAGYDLAAKMLPDALRTPPYGRKA
jgi:5,10-methylenetetrahydrofolate reductase